MKKLLTILLMLTCFSLGARAARCKAITQKGIQCSRNAVTAGYCTQHYKIHKRNQNNPGYDEKVKTCYDANGKPRKLSMMMSVAM